MKTIAVIFGGRSTEHDVSVVTALSSVIKPLEMTKKYKVEAVYIAKDGSWHWDDKLKDIKLFSSGKIDEFLEKNRPLEIKMDAGLTLVRQRNITSRKETCRVDVVFPATHGTYGEDGSLMGLLRMANVPFVGCDMDASVLAMDKVLAKQIAESNGIKVTKYVCVTSNSDDNYDQEVSKIDVQLSYPLFVKPAHLGSSIGIGRAKDKTELINALEVALHYDNKVIVEEEVTNLIEVTLPIIGNEKPRPALLERPLTNSEDFFDFDTKYMQGGKKSNQDGGAKGAQGYSELPAKIDDDLYKNAEDTGLRVYKVLGCSGIARVDMLIDDKTKTVYFNEVNPLPGGLYEHNWRAKGVSSIELVQTLVELAEEKWQNKKSLNTVFSTNYLKQF